MGFNCISAFEVHVRDHIEDISKDQSKGPKTYQCMWEGCTTFCVRDKAKIQAHIQKHTNLRKFACANCGGTFYNKNKFLEHFKRQAKLGSGYELDKVVYQCSICSKTFQTQLLLRDHIRSHVHNYMCQYCHMTFPTPSGLRKHILYRHKNERKFPCGQCDYRAKEAGDLRVHMEKHLKEKRPKLECPECDYCSFNYDSVTQHMKMKHTENGQNYICHICSKKFGDGRCLSRHLCRVHDFRRPPGVDKFRYTQGPDGLFRLFKDKFESKKLLMTKELQKKAADKLLSLGVISDKEIDLVVRSDSGEEQQMKFVSYHNALKELTKEHSDDEEDSLEDNTISVQVSPCSSQTVPDL